MECTGEEWQMQHPWWWGRLGFGSEIALLSPWRFICLHSPRTRLPEWYFLSDMSFGLVQTHFIEQSAISKGRLVKTFFFLPLEVHPLGGFSHYFSSPARICSRVAPSHSRERWIPVPPWCWAQPDSQADAPGFCLLSPDHSLTSFKHDGREVCALEGSWMAGCVWWG